MVMASTEVRKVVGSAIPIQTPLLSIIVPVYNGSKRIESTLQKLKDQTEKLESVLAKLEIQAEKHKKSFVYTGRSVIEDAGAAMLLDEYFSTHPTDMPSGIQPEDDNADFLSQGAEERIHLGNDSSSILSPQWYEIIVVNDGSKDNTRDIVGQISSTDGTIQLISYSPNMGKGYAIKQGVMQSRGKYVIFMDGDGNIGTERLRSYLQRLENADMIIGSKYLPTSIVHAPLSRRLLSKCFHYVVRILLGTKVRDTQVGLKVGRGDAFRKIFKSVLVKRYAFDAEMLTIAGLLGLRIVEMPVRIDLDKGFKKMEIVRMALDVLGIAYRLRVRKWYQKNLAKEVVPIPG